MLFRSVIVPQYVIDQLSKITGGEMIMTTGVGGVLAYGAFIFLVSNIGGSLTPLGDPPLFVGFLRGVDFFWTTQHLWTETLFVAALCLAIFFGLDTWLYTREAPLAADPTPDTRGVQIVGLFNLLLIAGAVAGAIALKRRLKIPPAPVSAIHRPNAFRTRRASKPPAAAAAADPVRRPTWNT